MPPLLELACLTRQLDFPPPPAARVVEEEGSGQVAPAPPPIAVPEDDDDDAENSSDSTAYESIVEVSGSDSLNPINTRVQRGGRW